MRIFIDGYGVVAQSVLRKLLENHNVKKQDILVNTYKIVDNGILLNYLNENGINYFCEKYNEHSVKSVRKFNPHYIISAYGRRILPQEILSFAQRMAFNFHPSLLPNYKGCFSSAWTIINKENKTGITFHEMVEEIDAGNILFQEEVLIDSEDTAYSLYNKLASKFIQVFDEFFFKLNTYQITPRKMPEGGEYYPRRIPFGGIINPEWEDSKVEAFIRGIHFPPFRGASLPNEMGGWECESVAEYKQKILKYI